MAPDSYACGIVATMGIGEDFRDPGWSRVLDRLRSGSADGEIVAEALDALEAGPDLASRIADLEEVESACDAVEVRFVLSEARHLAGDLDGAEALLRRDIGEPAVRQRLNRLGKDHLPRVQERRRLYACNRLVALQGRNVLEVGGMLPKSFVAVFQPSSWTSLDLGATGRVDGWYRIVCADAAEIPLPDDSVDVVFSSSAFEHIGDLGGCLAELARVLTPGGTVFSEFSPIWSGPQGHHLRGVAREVLRKAGAWPLPDWLHLTLTPRQMRRELQRKLPAEDVRHVERWLYRRKTLNRLFYEDYVHLFHASPLDVVTISRREGSAPDVDTLRLLRRRQPGRDSFQVRGMRVVLRKPAPARRG